MTHLISAFSRRFKAFVVPLSMMGLCLTAAFSLPNPSPTNQQLGREVKEVGTQPASKKDLKSEAGEKILEITQATYRTSPGSLDSSSVMVKNLSGKNVTAVGLLWTLVYTDGERCQVEQLVDYRIHRDIAAANGVQPFAPYEEKYIPRPTKEALEAGRGIAHVEVEVAFAEFDGDGGAVIGKSEMHKQLLDKREGAEIYKRWVEEGYDGAPLKLDAVVRKLSGDELPDDRRLAADKVRQGALVYKQWMLGVLKDKGAGALQEQLRRNKRLLDQK